MSDDERKPSLCVIVPSDGESSASSLPDLLTRELRAVAAREIRVMAATPEPLPVPNDKPALWDLVVTDARRQGMPEYLVDDMRARDKFGREKYGTSLQAGNGRDALVDALQEALDLSVYLKQALVEGADGRGRKRRARADEAKKIAPIYADTLSLAARIRSLLWARDGR